MTNRQRTVRRVLSVISLKAMEEKAMFANHDDALRQHSTTKRGLALAGFIVSLLLVVVPVSAQNSFNSGSTGADGAFAPATTQSIAVPDSGVFNFTTVNIPANVTITFTRNATNKPLTIRASGDVVITGTINIDGKPGNSNGNGGLGGPGGFNGGATGYGFDQSFSGTAGDGPSGDKVAEVLGDKCVNRIGQTTLAQLINELRECDLLLTNDTGTMHLADLLRVPTVSIFGSTEPQRTGPLGQGHRIFRHHVECSPCFLRECPLDFRCMAAVTSAEVIAGIEQMMAK